ncbi:MAG: DNA mismatch repair MutL family protein, partial [Planctomycetota bacterium]
QPPGLAAAVGAEVLWQSLYDGRADQQSPEHPQQTAELQTAAHVGGPRQGDRRPAIQLHNAYLVTETDDGLIIIDQHALHERVLYEQLRERLTVGSLESQRLLLPETVEATPRQIAVLQSNAELLGRLGIEVTPFGTNAVAVHAFPSLLADTDAKAFVRDLTDKLSKQGEAAHTEELIHELLDMMACKAAVKAGDPLTPQEIDALIASKDLIEKSSNCPHGRPTTLRLDLRDLERQFKRT